jgi:Tol biopolymer transport system component
MCVLLVAGARSAGRTSGVIAFARADGIYAMDVDGSHVQRLMHIRPASIRWVASIRSLAWSPDGKKLAYWMRGQIWVMNADGTHTRGACGCAGG